MKSQIAPSSSAVAPDSSEHRHISDRRTRARERRRNELYETAVALFIEQGFDGTTVDEIADRADVARATVFNYFPRKTAFLDEWTARRRARAANAMADVANKDLDQLLRRYMLEMVRISEETRDETRALLSAALQQTNFIAHPELAHDLAAVIRNAEDDSGSTLRMHPERAGLVLATSYFAVLDQWITAEVPEFDLESELMATFDLILYGALTDQNKIKSASYVAPSPLAAE